MRSRALLYLATSCGPIIRVFVLPISEISWSILSFLLPKNFWSRSPVGFSALPERATVLVSTFRCLSLPPLKALAAVPLGSCLALKNMAARAIGGHLIAVDLK